MCGAAGVVKAHCGAKELCFQGWAKGRRPIEKKEVVKQPPAHSQNWGGQLRGLDSELRTRGGVEIVDDVLQTHPRAVGFAFCAISYNVGSGDEGKVEELAVNVGC